jgi:hypothetical protein
VTLPDSGFCSVFPARAGHNSQAEASPDSRGDQPQEKPALRPVSSRPAGVKGLHPISPTPVRAAAGTPEPASTRSSPGRDP